MTMVCNNCLQEILAGESFWEDETEGPAYHEDCRQAALDRRNKAEEERDAASDSARLVLEQQRRLYDNLRLANTRLDNYIANLAFVALAIQAGVTAVAWNNGTAMGLVVWAGLPLLLILLGGFRRRVIFRGAGAAEWGWAAKMAAADEAAVYAQLLSDEIEAVQSLERLNRDRSAVAGRSEWALAVQAATALVALIVRVLGVTA